jgi:transcription elongation factor GreB
MVGSAGLAIRRLTSNLSQPNKNQPVAGGFREGGQPLLEAFGHVGMLMWQRTWLCLGVSKAFTRESDDASGDEIEPVRPHAPLGAKRYITRRGAERLRQEANVLLEKKSALLNGPDAASADAPGRMRRIEAAIQRIQQTLNSVIVAEPPADSGKVGFGASVRIRYQHGEEETYQIVGADEAEPGQGRISAISPLAQALMNSKVGDTVQFKSPAGDQELTVLAVHYYGPE